MACVRNGGVLRCTFPSDAKEWESRSENFWNREGYETIDTQIATIVSSRRPQAWQVRSDRMAWCAETVVALADT